MSLGRTTDVSLEQARERANELTSAARGGRDLIGEEGEARDAAASRITVEKLIELYLRRRVAGRLRTAKSIESRLKRALVARSFNGMPQIFVDATCGSFDSVADQGQRAGSGKTSAGLHGQCSGGRCRRTSLRRTRPPG